MRGIPSLSAPTTPRGESCTWRSFFVVREPLSVTRSLFFLSSVFLRGFLSTFVVTLAVLAATHSASPTSSGADAVVLHLRTPVDPRAVRLFDNNLTGLRAGCAVHRAPELGACSCATGSTAFLPVGERVEARTHMHEPRPVSKKHTPTTPSAGSGL